MACLYLNFNSLYRLSYTCLRDCKKQSTCPEHIIWRAFAPKEESGLICRGSPVARGTRKSRRLRERWQVLFRHPISSNSRRRSRCPSRCLGRRSVQKAVGECIEAVPLRSPQDDVHRHCGQGVCSSVGSSHGRMLVQLQQPTSL